MKKKIYIIGDLRGAYRNKIVFNFLNSNDEYNISGSYQLSKGVRVTNVYSMIKHMIKMLTSDMIYVCACNHNARLAKVAYLTHKKIITDFYISFYDTDVLDRKNYPVNSRIAIKLQENDRKALRNSSLSIFLNNSEARYYTTVLGVNLQDIGYKIIPLCIPAKKRAQLPYYNKKREYIRFCWCGTYIPLQGLEKIIEAASIAIKSGLNMRLTIWGDSVEKAQPYIQMAEDHNISQNIDFINSWDDIDNWENYIVENCDVTFGIFGDSDKAKTVLANKVVDGVAYRTPVITGESKGVREFFNDELFICENAPAVIAEKMIEVSMMSLSDIKEQIEHAYDIYLNNFTPAVFERNLISAIGEVI